MQSSPPLPSRAVEAAHVVRAVEVAQDAEERRGDEGGAQVAGLAREPRERCPQAEAEQPLAVEAEVRTLHDTQASTEISAEAEAGTRSEAQAAKLLASASLAAFFPQLPAVMRHGRARSDPLW